VAKTQANDSKQKYLREEYISRNTGQTTVNGIQIGTRLDFTGTPLPCPMTNVFVH